MKKTFNIIGKRKIYFIFSSVLVLASLVSLIIFGLKPGIDFTGGSLIKINFSETRPTLEEIKISFANMDLVGMDNIIVQPTGDNSFIIRMRFVSEDEHQQILGSLRKDFENIPEAGTENLSENKVLEESFETIGASISSQLKSKSFKTAFVVILIIIAYIAYAFRRVAKPINSWKYGVVATIALAHDVIITMGVFSILGYLYNYEVDLPFIVALLTILGYSVNDTIVVFDRVRENLIKYGYDNFEDVVNKGVNETFVRSFNTSFTTLLVLFALYFFGGESIHNFCLALIIGISFGTYSSIFLASPLLVVWNNLKK